MCVCESVRACVRITGIEGKRGRKEFLLEVKFVVLKYGQLKNKVTGVNNTPQGVFWYILSLLLFFSNIPAIPQINHADVP